MRYLLILMSSVLLSTSASAFCGFYVASAGAKVFNKSSQVILVRDGNRSVVTMNNDFSGEVKDFAIVVPVPTVLQREQIRISEQALFDQLDQYSSPRLVEYHDQNPCNPEVLLSELRTSSVNSRSADFRDGNAMERKKKTTVKIEAKYDVEEYKILILSAKKSSDLEVWLRDNGYSLPNNAKEVLEPYIKTGMKFFVVKVNLEKYYELNPHMQGKKYAKLRPIQIEYNSPKFMLPIRLGMANANGYQDLIVYAFSRKGRVEVANYPTREIPTNVNIPSELKPRFQEFYAALYQKAWERNNRTSVMLEYAWDLSGFQTVKCDPCNGPPPIASQMMKAGVDWLQTNNRGYEGDVFFTRLHARYDRTLYPEDFRFQETPNRKQFQGRYVMHHRAQGDLSCDEGQAYLKTLKKRQVQEQVNLAYLTGWESDLDLKEEDKNMLPVIGNFDGGNGGGNSGGNGSGLIPAGWSLTQLLLSVGGLLTLFSLLVWQQWRRRQAAVESA